MHIYNTENMLGRILFQYNLNINLSLFILLELYTKNNYIYFVYIFSINSRADILHALLCQQSGS